MRTRIRFGVGASLIYLAGCGEHAATATGGAAAATSDTAGAFTLIATDAGFEAPDRVASGMRHIVYENHGTQIHEAMFIKLAPGMTARDYVSAVKGGALFPEGARDYSGPGLTSSGGKAELWLELDPGNYIIICWMQDHPETIPVHELTVDPERRDDPPPSPDVVVKLVDFRIDIEGELHAGPQVMRVEMVGPSMHEMDLYRLEDGKTLDDVKTWYKDNHQEGPPPGRVGTGILDSHDITRVVTIKQELTPGRYVLECQMPMSTDPAAPRVNVTHLDAGMVREVTIQ